MIFCTKCGHKNVDDARFCEECGNPVGAKPAPPAQASQAPSIAPSVTPSMPTAGKGGAVKWVAAGVLALVAIGGGLAFMLSPESPSNDRFAAAIERSLADNPQAYKARYCVSNFAYNLDPVRINEQDEGTRRWMAVLTKAGLYNEPEVSVDNSGFFFVRQLRFTKTEAGKKATDGRTLCVADGVTVAKVESFTPPEKLGSTEASRATVTFKLRNPMPWIADEEAKAVGPAINAEFSESVILTLKEGKWVVANDQEVQAGIAAQRKLNANNPSQETASSGGPGFFASLSKIFSFGGNPLIGRWRPEVKGFGNFGAGAFEFEADTMISGGQKIKVRYEVEDKRVTVYANGESNGMIFNVIDSNTLTMNAGLMEIKLIREN